MMIRTTCILSFLAMVSAGSVFWVSYEVERLEHAIAQAERKQTKTRQTIAVLEAEWSLVNQPSRLSAMVQQHLQMQPVKAQQILSMEAIPYRQDDQTASTEQPEDPKLQENPASSFSPQPQTLPDMVSYQPQTVLPMHKPANRPVLTQYQPIKQAQKTTPARPRTHNAELDKVLQEIGLFQDQGGE